MHNIRFIRSLIAGAGLLMVGSLQAQSPYWPDTGGSVIRDGFGECVQTTDWRPELATVECGAEAPAPAAAAEPAREPESRAQSVTLSESIRFEFDSAELTPAARAQLEQLAAQVRGLDRVVSIEVAGHTCCTGTEEYNQELSERRAESVKRYLIDKGIDARQIETEGYGFSQPVGSGLTPEGRAANRRVEIIIQGAQ